MSCIVEIAFKSPGNVLAFNSIKIKVWLLRRNVWSTLAFEACGISEIIKRDLQLLRHGFYCQLKKTTEDKKVQQ